MSQITIEQLQNVLNYNPTTGIFTWKIKTCRKVVVGAIAGYRNPDGYKIIRVEGVRYRDSRLAWFYMTSQWPTGTIDHIDGNPCNNTFQNLRDVSTAGNNQNQRRAHSRNKTGGFLGVSKQKHSRRWRARICTNGVQKILGWFDTPEEAHQAYVAAKRLHHATCTI